MAEAGGRLIDSAGPPLAELAAHPAQSLDHIGGRRFPACPVDVLGMYFGNLDGRNSFQSS